MRCSCTKFLLSCLVLELHMLFHLQKLSYLHYFFNPRFISWYKLGDFKRYITQYHEHSWWLFCIKESVWYVISYLKTRAILKVVYNFSKRVNLSNKMLNSNENSFRSLIVILKHFGISFCGTKFMMKLILSYSFVS